MQGSHARPIAGVFEREIQRFLRTTIRRDTLSLYRGRQATERLHRSYAILVARLDGGPIADFRATLYDVSSQGIGFLSSRPFPIGAVLGVKLDWANPNAYRVPAIVRHSTRTNRGLLIGAEFAHNSDEVCKLLEEPLGQWYG